MKKTSLLVRGSALTLALFSAMPALAQTDPVVGDEDTAERRGEVQGLTKQQKAERIARLEKEMREAAKMLEFELAAALRKMPEELQDIVVLTYYDGKPLTEVAKIMHLSYGAVKLRHQKALVLLRNALQR